MCPSLFKPQFMANAFTCCRKGPFFGRDTGRLFSAIYILKRDHHTAATGYYSRHTIPGRP